MSKTKGSFLIIIILLSTLPSFALSPVSLFLEYTSPFLMSYDTSGDHLVYFDSSAFGIGAQYNIPINSNLEGDIGAVYYLPRTISLASSEGNSHSRITNGSMNYLPLFGRIKFTFNPESDMKIYVGTELKYTLISVGGKYFDGVNTNDRLGFGGFAGINIINGFGLEAGTVIQNGSIEYKDSNVEFVDLSTYIRANYSF